jgi:hypothetical protein
MSTGGVADGSESVGRQSATGRLNSGRGWVIVIETGGMERGATSLMQLDPFSTGSATGFGDHSTCSFVAPPQLAVRSFASRNSRLRTPAASSHPDRARRRSCRANRQPAADDETDPGKQEQNIKSGLAVRLNDVMKMQDVMVHHALDEIKKAPA